MYQVELLFMESGHRIVSRTSWFDFDETVLQYEISPSRMLPLGEISYWGIICRYFLTCLLLMFGWQNGNARAYLTHLSSRVAICRASARVVQTSALVRIFPHIFCLHLLYQTYQCHKIYSFDHFCTQFSIFPPFSVTNTQISHHSHIFGVFRCFYWWVTH